MSSHEEALQRVVASVHPLFASHLSKGKLQLKFYPLTQVNSAFVDNLRLFKDEGMSATPMLDKLAKWCRMSFLPRAASDFLSSHRMQTLLWAMMIPLSWLDDQRTIFESSLALWHSFDITSKEASEIRRLLSTLVRDMPKYAAECAVTLSSSVRAARVSRVLREDADLISRASFAATVPLAIQNVVCLLVRLGVTSIRIPHYVLPRHGKIYAERMNVLRLIAKMPKHIHGLQFEKRFAEAVFADSDAHCLHAALIFCTTEWVEEFKLRGFTRSLAEKRALASLHLSSFTITYEDALQLLELSATQ